MAFAASPVTKAAAATAAEIGTVVQDGGRLTVPSGEEGAVTLRFTATLAPEVRGPVSAVLRVPTMLVETAGGPPVSEDVIRSTCAVDGVARRIQELGAVWDDSSSVHLYSQRPMTTMLRDVLAERGLRPTHGILWHDAAAPVFELELEVDVRHYECEIVLPVG